MQSPVPDPATVRVLSAELHLEEPVCRLLCVRGVAGPDEARAYLRPRLDQLHDPGQMQGMDVAVERLARAARDGERVLIHGDYDVDGICSTTILLQTLRDAGADARPFIPDRLRDGYDLTRAGVSAAVQAGATLIITADCGTTAVEPVREARARGIDVIITDHHLPAPGAVLPAALAILNPRQPGCAYPDKGLVAAGVAYKLALALVRRLGARAEPVHAMLDLVALATVADVAPLRGENRVLVRHGLRVMQRTANTGLRALLRSSGLDRKELTAGRVGFILAPRLNAAGRLASALEGVRLLTTQRDDEANRLARDLEELNRRRQECDRRTLDQALEMAGELDLEQTLGVVLARADWHPGVIGIVASRLVEQLGRPVVLLAQHDGRWRGSGRSVTAFDLHAGLTECSDLLDRYGGHRLAAGVTLPEAAGAVEEFASRFNAVARRTLAPDDLSRTVRIDMPLNLADATGEFERRLRHFEPFGIENPAPIFAAEGVRLAGRSRVVGRDHLRLRLAQDDAQLDAIGWGMGGLRGALERCESFAVAYRLERDEWNGADRLQARLVDVHL